MNKEEKLICEFVFDFVDKNWGKIDKDKCQIDKPKKAFLKEVKTDVQAALWVITQVAWWAMDERYLKEIWLELPEECNFDILKIGDKYIKLTLSDDHTYKTEPAIPKTKTVVYFE